MKANIHSIILAQIEWGSDSELRGQHANTYMKQIAIRA